MIMRGLTTSIYEELSRTETKFQKWARRAFKAKEVGDDFLKTVKIWSEALNDHLEFKMRLDTGCEIHNLITSHVVDRLQMHKHVAWKEEVLCTCLNGEQLLSVGTITLSWKGKRFRKVFTTTFHIVDTETLPWEVILGGKTIQEHGILKFAGFGGATIILPKKKKEEHKDAKLRKQQQKERAAANEAKVNADIKAKEDAARQQAQRQE